MFYLQGAEDKSNSSFQLDESIQSGSILLENQKRNRTLNNMDLIVVPTGPNFSAPRTATSHEMTAENSASEMEASAIFLTQKQLDLVRNINVLFFLSVFSKQSHQLF